MSAARATNNLQQVIGVNVSDQKIRNKLQGEPRTQCTTVGSGSGSKAFILTPNGSQCVVFLACRGLCVPHASAGHDGPLPNYDK